MVPAFEIIATVASSEPGPDGTYSSMIDPQRLRPWVQAAQDAGVYVTLDLQPGRADFLTQAKRYASLVTPAKCARSQIRRQRLRSGYR